MEAVHADHQPQLPTLLERQRHLEDESLAEGARRFRERLKVAQENNRGSTVGGARKLLQGGLEPLQNAIAGVLSEKIGGRQHVAKKWVKLIGADTASFLTLKVVLDGITSGEPRHARTVALDISELIVDELRYRRFKKEAPSLFEYKIHSFNTSNYAHMARSMDAAVLRTEIDTEDLEMSQQDRIMVGMKLLDLLVASTGLVTTETIVQGINGKAKKSTVVIPTEETLKWIQDRNQALEYFFPVNLPMLHPPRQWGPGQRGGYLFALMGKHPLVRGITKQQAKVVQQAGMPTVYAAVNRIQETPWRINQRVLELLETIHGQGGGLASVPPAEDEPMPTKPHDIDTNEEARKEWRKLAGRAKNRNHTLHGKRMEFDRVLKVAKQFRNEDAIWFPYNLDFRGRVYPIVNYLHPQGDDLCKSLLTFATGKPLTRDGIGWLALHGANVLKDTPDGLNLAKATLQERADWISDHTAEICMVAADPLSHTWWMKADKPLQFFAFCVEWSAFVDLEVQGRGDEYVCSLPCAMDGTCNGLQHFAALFRDEIGGRAVNVTPNERPQDIYQTIADVVLEKLEKLAVKDELARLWLSSGLVNRKLTKAPTMTFGYGSKKFGFKDQLMEFLEHKQTKMTWKGVKAHFTLAGDERPAVSLACAYMSSLIWDALGEVVVMASKGMAWMQEVARKISKNKQCASWSVPGTWFPVRQEYFKVKARQIKTVLAGKACKPCVYDNTAAIDPIKQGNAIAPNIIHSLDASALMLTVENAAANGVDHFGMVHDSYATHAADCPVLAHCTRDSFFNLYSSQDVIGDIAGQLKALTGKPEECPAPPEKGTLDISGVLASDFLFS